MGFKMPGGVARTIASDGQQIDARLNDLREAHDNLEARFNGLAMPISDQEKISYQQASDWVRMVNSITWTLSSIYLVGAIIALNGVMQKGVDPAWRFTVGLVVAGLCLVWAAVDVSYVVMSLDARKTLVSIEAEWKSKFPMYTQQMQRKKLRFFLNFILVYVPILGLFVAALIVAFKKWPLPPP
jgi:uncharacterized protein YukE